MAEVDEVLSFFLPKELEQDFGGVRPKRYRGVTA
jgi:hypothetical protein